MILWSLGCFWNLHGKFYPWKSLLQSMSIAWGGNRAFWTKHWEARGRSHPASYPGCSPPYWATSGWSPFLVPTDIELRSWFLSSSLCKLRMTVTFPVSVTLELQDGAVAVHGAPWLLRRTVQCNVPSGFGAEGTVLRSSFRSRVTCDVKAQARMLTN